MEKNENPESPVQNESKQTPEVAGGQSQMQPNVAAALSYVLGFISGIFFLLTEKNNRFVRFHAWQSIFFSLALVVVSWVVGLIPFIGWYVSSAVSLAAFLLWLFLMYKAYSNEEFKLPVLGEYAEKYINQLK